MNESDTPETDAAIKRFTTRPCTDGEANFHDFARTLEKRNKRLVEALQRAIARFDDNKHFNSDDGLFWKTCAWSMADDLRRANADQQEEKP